MDYESEVETRGRGSVWPMILGMLFIGVAFVGLVAAFEAIEGQYAGAPRIEAEVTRLWAQPHGDDRMIYYRFRTPAGELIETREEVSDEVFEAHRVGGTATVEYLTDNPSWNRLARESSDPWVFRYIGWGLVGAGALWAVWTIISGIGRWATGRR
ncbi:MAG: DUF3592 domain-containing protein [Paracoccaceae bacterium]